MNNPCEECDYRLDSQRGCQIKRHRDECLEYAKYLGYQEGLAEAESRVKAREREIVEWLKMQHDILADKEQNLLIAIDRLEAWL